MNTLKITVESALQELNERRGFALEEQQQQSDGDDVLEQQPVDEGFVRIDSLIPYVLEFAPGTDLHDDPLVLNGSLILQDKVRLFFLLFQFWCAYPYLFVI